MQTSMNADLQIDQAEVMAESPVHLPAPAIPVTVWVGALERPAFLQQAQKLAAAWGCAQFAAPEKHHFNLIEGLTGPQNKLMGAIVD